MTWQLALGEFSLAKVAAGALLVLFLWMSVRGIRKSLVAERGAARARRGLCPACGYDLRGSADAPRCPECGAERPAGAEPPPPPDNVEARVAGYIVLLLIVGVAAAVAIFIHTMPDIPGGGH